MHEVIVRLYDNAGSDKQISSQEAIVDQESGMLIYGPHLTATVRLVAQKIDVRNDSSEAVDHSATMSAVVSDNA